MLRRVVPTLLLLVSSSALAGPPVGPIGTDRQVVYDTRPPVPGTEQALVSPLIYLTRCIGGCTLTPSTDDDASQNKISNLLASSQITLSEFAHGDQAWNDLVQCVKEIYSPFDVQITETRPAAGTQYHMAVIGGTNVEGQRPDALGVAVVRTGDCAPRNNAVSLTFANSHQTGTQLVSNLCWTVGQESAHAFGLDHSFKWLDGRSTCNDPLTYQTDCGGQRFYRNDTATCGEFAKRECACGSTQNSHAKLLAVFGANPGTPLIGPPTVQVTTPANGAQLGAVVAANAGSKRGVAKVELLLNGFKWAEAKGALFGTNGQPNPSPYSLTVPTKVPNSVIDVVVRACDDIGQCADSATVTVTKGGPCADASTCLTGQKCEAGKCFWDPPAGEVGDACTYPEFCKTQNCQGPDPDSMICTQACVPGSADSCPAGLDCVMTGAATGICYTKSDSGGCCSVGNDSGPSWLVHAGFGAVILGLLLRRRRK